MLNKYKYLFKYDKVTLIFTLLITYFLIIALSVIFVHKWITERGTMADNLRNFAISALAFSEEGYHTQLEVWEYAYEPNQHRLIALNRHLNKLKDVFSDMKNHYNHQIDYLDPQSIHLFIEIETTLPQIQNGWNKIKKSISAQQSNQQIRVNVFSTEHLFDETKKKVDTLFKLNKEISSKLDAQNNSDHTLLVYWQIAEVAFGIVLAGFVLLYIRKLETHRLIQQQKIIISSKFSALGEMAGGIAHEINNPLAIIKSISEQILELANEDPFNKELVVDMSMKIVKTSDRIDKIIKGLYTFARDGSKDNFELIHVKNIIDETLSFCSERLKKAEILVSVDAINEDLTFEGRATEISQVLLNLFNNSFDAIAKNTNKWIKVQVVDKSVYFEIRVTDSGNGIPQKIQEKIFQPFFTTKEIGKGTGLGLSISSGIIAKHNGNLKIDANNPNTCFIIQLPKKQKTFEQTLRRDA